MTQLSKSEKAVRKYTIKNFMSCIPWVQIEYIMGKREYKKFCKWMYGQTCPIGGVYIDDLDRYLKGMPVID